MRRVAGVFALAVFAVVGFGAAVFETGSGATPTAAAATSRVTVVGTEFKFKLSKRSVPTGTVIFTFKNKGKIAHNFKIAGKKTPIIAPGKSAALKVKIPKKGRFAYVCTLAGHAQAGMKGVLVVGSTAPPPTTTTEPPQPPPPPPPPTTTVPGPATTIRVDMFEYRFDLSQASVPSGTVTFVITNRGSEPHNFDIAGVRAGAILGPGQTETWTVGLPPKTYITVCDVPFHVDRGMTGNLTVT
jgi:uncharacterized cupredoxin-like copper-binding protein